MRNNSLFSLIFTFILCLLLLTFFSSQAVADAESDDHWKKTTSLTDATITAIAATVDASQVFALARGRGLYRSDDGGKTWTLISDATQWAFGQQLFYKINTLFVVSKKGPVFASHDGGVTSELISAGLPVSPNNRLAYDNNNGLFYLVNTASGLIYKTLGAGSKWEALSSLGEGIQPTSFLSVHREIYVGTAADGVYESSDRGQSWFKISKDFDHFSIDQLVYFHSNLYVRHNDDGHSTPRVLFESLIGGVNWQNISPTDAAHMISTNLCATDDVLYLSTTGGVYKSTDEGVTWLRLNKGLTSRVVFQVIETRFGLFAGTLRGMFNMSPVYVNRWLADIKIDKVAGAEGDV